MAFCPINEQTTKKPQKKSTRFQTDESESNQASAASNPNFMDCFVAF